MSLLGKVWTVLKYCKESWNHSRFVMRQIADLSSTECAVPKNRLWIYFDLIYCFLRYGDDFNDYCTFRFWEKNAKERDTYISLKRNDVLRFAMSTPEIHKLFLNKAVFNERYAKYIKRGWMVTSGCDRNNIVQFVQKYGSVIAKPIDDFGGHGVKLLRISDECLNMHINEIIMGGGNYILEETICNTEQIKHIAPGSLNTLRVVTVIDKQNQLHIVACLLRMGNGTAITDNYHDGGMACPIELSTYKMKRKAYAMGCKEYAEHPYSHIIFDGYAIDGVKECIDLAKEIAFVEPEARYVGWDFAITPKGIEILEGNIPPGEDITQIAAGKGLWYEMLNWK